MTEATRTKARIVGTLRPVDGTGVVRMEGRYDTDIDDLWSALTEPERLARWIVEVAGDLQVGGEFSASFTSSWEGVGRIDVCERPNRLLVTMSPGTADETVIEAELNGDGEQTMLVIEERGLPLDVYADHGAGWQAHVEDLDTHLAGRERTDWQARWTELMPSYREQAAGLG
jgi:uncharacterized protein YndB with AHSA1/START domain